MTLAFFLKILNDLCFYSGIVALFGSYYGLESSLLPQLVLLALAAALSRLLWEKRPILRLLPLLLLLPALLLPCETAGRVLLLAPVLYVLWTVAGSRFSLGYYAAADLFLLELKLLPVPLVLMLALSQLSMVERYSLPYVLVLVLGSILLLRMLRHDEETLRQPRFRLMNLLSLAVLCLLGLFLGSSWFRGAVLWVLGRLWDVISVPIAWVVGAFGALLAVTVGNLLSALFKNGDPETMKEILEHMESGQQETQNSLEQAATQTESADPMVRTLLLLALLVLLSFFLFRALRSRGDRETPPAGVQSRLSAQPLPPGEKPLSRLNARTPAQQVRYRYRQLLLHARQEGAQISGLQTSRQQTGAAEEVCPDREALDRLRQLYLPARYADQATGADAREARELVKRLKKQ